MGSTQPPMSKALPCAAVCEVEVEVMTKKSEATRTSDEVPGIRPPAAPLAGAASARALQPAPPSMPFRASRKRSEWVARGRPRLVGSMNRLVINSLSSVGSTSFCRRCNSRRFGRLHSSLAD